MNNNETSLVTTVRTYLGHFYSLHVISPSFLRLQRCPSCPLGGSRLMLQHRRPQGHVSWEPLFKLPAGWFLQCPPLPDITHQVFGRTLPVTETAALEEEVAAGHGADLTRLLQPDGCRDKGRNISCATVT